MERVTPVTSLTRNGLYDWLLQRVSAVILAAYSLFVFFYILCNPDLTYEQWRALFDAAWMRIFSLIALLMILVHAWIGLWTVLTDYVTPRLMGSKAVFLRFVLQALIVLVMVVVAIFGIDLLWRS